MLDIKKIGKNFYLVGGEYTASNFNEAVIIANKNNKIKVFTVDSMQASFWKNLKNKLNYPFKVLESWMWLNGRL